MQCLFPNLYRFTDEPFRKGRKYAYLIVRKKGNLLLPFKGGSVSDLFKEIERLGGVDTQFIVPALWLKPPSFRRDRFQRAAVLS